MDKRNRKEGTCNLLKQCVLKRVIPRSFNSANTELFEDFCTASKNRWNATTFIRIQISLDHHLKCLENIEKKFSKAKTVLYTKQDKRSL